MAHFFIAAGRWTLAAGLVLGLTTTIAIAEDQSPGPGCIPATDILTTVPKDYVKIKTNIPGNTWWYCPPKRAETPPTPKPSAATPNPKPSTAAPKTGVATPPHDSRKKCSMFGVEYYYDPVTETCTVIRRPAQLPPKEFIWTGLYLGGGVGGNWTDGNWNTTQVISKGIADRVDDPLKSMFKADPVGTAFLGYMYAAQYWILGEEVFFDFFNAAMDPGIPGTGAIGTAAVRSNDSVTVRSKWDIALRSRVGYLITPSTQAYVAGGPAWLHMDATVNCTAAGVCGTNGIPAFTQTNSTTKGGWTVGGGIEQQLWGQWRGRIEYRYSDYGKWSTNFGTPANLAVAADIKLHTQSVMVGLSYAFGGL